MIRPKIRTVVGTILSFSYLALVIWKVVESFSCGSIEYCLRIFLSYFSMPWIFLIVVITKFLGIPHFGTKVGYFFFGLSIALNAVILFMIPRLLAKLVGEPSE